MINTAKEVTTMPNPNLDPDALGPCGCIDYHMADCPLRTGSIDSYYQDYDRDPYYDESQY